MDVMLTAVLPSDHEQIHKWMLDGSAARLDGSVLHFPMSRHAVQMYCESTDPATRLFAIRLREPPLSVVEKAFGDRATWDEKLGPEMGAFFRKADRIATDPLIGYLGLRNINYQNRFAEIAPVRIGHEDDRGKGYGTEACKLVLDYCWSIGLNRVSLNPFANNERAIACYKKAGFQIEGTLRQQFFIDGEFVDALMMSALYPTNQKVTANG